MQVNVKLNVAVYSSENINSEGEGLYKVKLRISPLDFFLDFKFLLAKASTGKYTLYPGSIKDKYLDEWKDKFEFSKQTQFYLYLLDAVIDEVESERGIIVTRSHRKDDELLAVPEPNIDGDPSEYMYWLKHN